MGLASHAGSRPSAQALWLGWPTAHGCPMCLEGVCAAHHCWLPLLLALLLGCQAGIGTPFKVFQEGAGPDGSSSQTGKGA